MQVNKAKRVFIQYARGPAFDKHMAELEASCERFWKAGRQQCEALSLTGNLCTNKVGGLFFFLVFQYLEHGDLRCGESYKLEEKIFLGPPNRASV